MVLVGLVVDRVLLYEASDEDLSCLNLVVAPSHNNIHKIETPRFMVVVDENTGVVIDLRTTDIDCNIVINDANGVDCTISNKYDYWSLWLIKNRTLRNFSFHVSLGTCSQQRNIKN